MNCPHCGKEINVGALLGSVKSKAKTRAARANAEKGGWPKGKPRKQNPKAGRTAGAGGVPKARRTKKGKALNDRSSPTAGESA